MENQDVSVVSANAGDTELASLDVTDIEIFLLGTMALWGDNKVTQKEMDFLLEKTRENIKDLKLFAFTDPADVELSCKEYLIELFSLIKKQGENTGAYADIEIPERCIKKLQKKNKEFEPTVKQRIIFMLLGVLEESYEVAEPQSIKFNIKKQLKDYFLSDAGFELRGLHRHARLSALQDDMKKLAEVDGEFSDEDRAIRH
ncbi:MAG: hypothetical protein VX225_01700 [Pseudomonadota bacterium]|nr:hypothetical protein [Pseudomonadota bacterium]